MKKFEDYVLLVNNALNKSVPENKSVVCDAMRYSLLSGGKRIRSVLALEFCRVCGGDIYAALPFACAVEMVHAYSLIHDDLPCMDDDDLRRGNPSCHVKFGEAFALLAGDALLTLAFETIMNAPLSAEIKVEACRILSSAAGFEGMIGGQELDLLNENKDVDAKELKKADLLKTGALIKASCLLGCAAAGASNQMRGAASVYAESIGLAFQIVDDILDATGDTESLGKPAGSDKAKGKATYITLLGQKQSKELSEELTQTALSSLKIFGGEGYFLRELALNLLSRTN
ncbi:MAG: polyprenyl synthetase family protein [Clostridiales bacterium]|jgi:geranylgeranyl diphosphate synthase type II|nr:polyprenyl synthetase family protein [Clostridiales bacterium]